MNSSSPVLIVGTPRSGTTLTAKILGRHSRIFMPGETHFFDDIYNQRVNLGQLKNSIALEKIYKKLSTIYKRYNENEDQKRIDKIFSKKNTYYEFKNKCGSFKDIYSWFLEIQMEIEGKKRWGNHVPRDLFNVAEIIRFYPEAKFVICVRDIKDFLVSYKNKWRKADKQKNRHRLKVIYHPIITSLLWKASIRQIKKLNEMVCEENRIIMKYEELVGKPEKSIKCICKTIGENYEPEMLHVEFNNSSFTLKRKGIYNNSIKRWKYELSQEEIEVTQLLAGEEIKYLGYEKLKINLNPIKFIPLFLQSSVAVGEGLRVNKEMRGSAIKYLFKRIRPLIC